jgi:hypothetical protein
VALPAMTAPSSFTSGGDLTGSYGYSFTPNPERYIHLGNIGGDDWYLSRMQPHAIHRVSKDGVPGYGITLKALIECAPVLEIALKYLPLL